MTFIKPGLRISRCAHQCRLYQLFTNGDFSDWPVCPFQLISFTCPFITVFNFILFVICASQHHLPLSEQNDSICFISLWVCSLEVLYFSDLLSINGSPTWSLPYLEFRFPLSSHKLLAHLLGISPLKKYFYLIATSQLILLPAHCSSAHHVLNLSYLETSSLCYIHFAGILRPCPSLCVVI